MSLKLAPAIFLKKITPLEINQNEKQHLIKRFNFISSNTNLPKAPQQTQKTKGRNNKHINIPKPRTKSYTKKAPKFSNLTLESTKFISTKVSLKNSTSTSLRQQNNQYSIKRLTFSQFNSASKRTPSSSVFGSMISKLTLKGTNNGTKTNKHKTDKTLDSNRKMEVTNGSQNKNENININSQILETISTHNCIQRQNVPLINNNSSSFQSDNLNIKNESHYSATSSLHNYHVKSKINLTLNNQVLDNSNENTCTIPNDGEHNKNDRERELLAMNQQNNEYVNFDNNSSNLSVQYKKFMFSGQFLNENSKKNKIVKLFIQNENSLYEIPNRFINDELIFSNNNSSNIHKNYSTNNSRDNSNCLSDSGYVFISNIKDKTNTLPTINLNSFLKLSAASVYVILSLCYEMYPVLIFNSSSSLSRKLNQSLHTLFEDTITKFKTIHQNILLLTKAEFILFKFAKQKKQQPIFDLVLKTKLISTLVNKTYTLKYSYIINKNKYTNIYIFDINSSNNKTWFYSENNYGNLPQNNNNHNNRYCHIQPIYPLKTKDIIEFHVNLFSANGIVEPDSIEWYYLNINETPKDFYQNKRVKTGINYNPLRSCEIEKMVLQWKSEYLLKHRLKIINEIKNIFGVYFEIEQFLFDFNVLYFFKFIMKAKKKGKLMKNKFIQFDLEIIGKECSIVKEIHNLCTLNSVTYKNTIQIRLGDVIIFYFNCYK
jgi:hypothetical protein